MEVPLFNEEMKMTRQASDESHSGCPQSLGDQACTMGQLELNVPVVKPIVSPAPRIPRLEGAEPPLLRQHQVVVGSIIKAPFRPQKITHHAVDGHRIS